MPDFQPLVDAGAFYLYTMAWMNLLGPFFAVAVVFGMIYGGFRFIKWLAKV